MAFDFSKLKEKNNMTDERSKALLPAYRKGCSEQSIVQIAIQRDEAKNQGRWELIFYYYYLEQIMRELQSQQDFSKTDWETPAWNEAKDFFKEPKNAIEGLKELERFVITHKIEGIEDIKDVIRILPNVIKSAK